MKLSNFKLEATNGSSPVDWAFIASVDVERGWWFWKTVERKIIYREFARPWRFVDTAELTPGVQAEALESLYRIQNNVPLRGGVS